MIASTVLTLTAAAEGRIAVTMGDYAHAVFLDLIRRIAPDLAETLHGRTPIKPFALSPLQGHRKIGRPGEVHLAGGEQVWLRFTTLDEEVTAALEEALLAASLEDWSIRLDQASFFLKDLTTEPTRHLWANRTTYAELLASASGESEITLRFHTPTAFRVAKEGGQAACNYPLPDPTRCFQGWLKRWNTFAPRALPEAVLAFVDDHVIIARHSLTTQIFQYRTGPQVGFVGMCAFQVRKGGIKDRLRQVNALADLAFYCGTGYKTTMGMGQTRRGD